jgi:threonine/homoserine/homoserine lactone efflux protein
VSIELWLAFVGASAILLVLPGPTILTVISYSVAHGRRANAALVAAVALGDSTALALSLVGLGALLATSGFWFTVVKWAGGLYLLTWVSSCCAPVRRAAAGRARGRGSRWKLFANTYLVTALNPKGIVFFVAFLPQFISPQASVVPQLWLLATTFVVLAVVNATLYAVFAASAAACSHPAGPAPIQPDWRHAAVAGWGVGADGPACGVRQTRRDRRWTKGQLPLRQGGIRSLGEIGTVMSCNCSICQRKGALMWSCRASSRDCSRRRQRQHLPVQQARDQASLLPTCGMHPYGEGKDAKGNAMASINVRCIEGIDLGPIPVTHFDGRSR